MAEPGTTGKSRLDIELVERGLAETRQKAQGLILAGAVRVNGSLAPRAALPVIETDQIDVDRPEEEYVGRGALKLLAGLDEFQVPVEGRIAADVGASTGGFTDVLLRRGAARVFAIDVGYGQLAWRLRQNPKVVVMERTNFRHLESLPEPIELGTVDVSFI